MANNEYFDAQEHHSEVVIREELNGFDNELIFEDVEYLDDDEIILPRESNGDLSVLSLDHEDVGVAPLQGKITLANLHEALAFESEHHNTPLNSFEVLAMQPGQSKSPSNQRRTSRSRKASPNTVKRRSSRIAKQNLQQESNKTIYPTAKGSIKQIGKKTASVTKQNPRKRASSRSRSRTASSAPKKPKSSSLSRKVSSTTKKARSASRRPRQMKK